MLVGLLASSVLSVDLAHSCSSFSVDEKCEASYNEFMKSYIRL